MENNCLVRIQMGERMIYSEILKLKKLKQSHLLLLVDLFLVFSIVSCSSSEDFLATSEQAALYFTYGNYDLSLEYCYKAENLVKTCGNSKEEREKKFLLYWTRCQLEVLRANYQDALEYLVKAEKTARKLDSNLSSSLPFMKAQIFAGLNDNDEALKIFDKYFEPNKEQLTVGQLSTYMILLYEAERFADASKIADYYYQNFEYVPEISKITSSIYEKNGEIKKAYLSVFLDFEYFSNYSHLNQNLYMKDLDKQFENQLGVEGLEERNLAVNLIKARFTKNTLQIDIPNENAFIAEKYIYLIEKLENENFSSVDVAEFLKLEKFFSKFPSYYWTCYHSFCSINPSLKKDYIPLLKHIIDLDNDNLYLSKAVSEVEKIYSKEN